MALNLYRVSDKDYEWCCYAFCNSRNAAKVAVAKEFDCDYIDMRCKTLKRGITYFSYPVLVTSPYDDGYEIVQRCGYEYAEVEE